MNTELVVKTWKISQEKGKPKTIAGTYSVRLGGNEIASETFNEGYEPTLITIPAELMVKVEELDKEIRQAIIDNFTK